MSFAQIDRGSGELLVYPDPFKSVSDADVTEAAEIEEKIITAKRTVELGFLALSGYLADFEERRLYLARGFDSFKSWCESPQIEIGYRVAQDLVRIQREVVPILEETIPDPDERMAVMVNAGVSKVRAMLPMLADPATKQDFLPMLENAPNMTWRDVREEVKQVRGAGSSIEDGFAAMFNQKIVGETDTHYKVQVRGTDGNNSDILGVLTVRKSWWNRFSQSIGPYEPTDRPF